MVDAWLCREAQVRRSDTMEAIAKYYSGLQGDGVILLPTRLNGRAGNAQLINRAPEQNIKYLRDGKNMSY